MGQVLPLPWKHSVNVLKRYIRFSQPYYIIESLSHHYPPLLMLLVRLDTYMEEKKKKERFHVKISTRVNLHTERYSEWNLLPRWRRCHPGEN